MNSDNESLQFYKMGLELKKQFDKTQPSFVKSVFIYGSVSRGEMVPGLSDLDVMVVLKKDTLKKREIYLLNRINKSVYKIYPIHMTFRIRSPSEMFEECSTTNDFGITSCLNYYRDAWYIYGDDLTNEFIKKIRRSKKALKENLRERILELRKNFRSFYSIHAFQSSTTTTSTTKRSLSYQIGDLLGELAQIVCLANGEDFMSTNEAIIKAAKLSKIKLFADANKIKQSKKHIDLFYTYACFEKLFHNLLKKNLNKTATVLRNQQFLVRDTVGLVLQNIKTKKYLILKRSTISNYWTVPKGGVNQGETFNAALKRELFEETGITKFVIKGEIPSLNHVYKNENGCIVKVKTHLFIAQTPDIEITLSSEHARFKWVDKKQFLQHSKNKINLLIAEYMV